MSTRAQELAQRLQAFNDSLVSLVTSAGDDAWRRTTDSEKWSVGAVARHVGATHYRIVELAKMMVAGQPVPEVKEEAILTRNEAQAIKHAACTKEEVMAILEGNGRAMVEYIAGLSDADLERGAYLPAFGGKITVRQMFETIIMQSAGGHLKSLQKTLARRD
ncbi:MAG: DinB family protein [Desulfatitalea sp.]|nr:DinB family protein [Desulfatitalea sp.]MBI5894785.1 DinB family protein [Desulfobacterales bacterium]